MNNNDATYNEIDTILYDLPVCFKELYFQTIQNCPFWDNLTLVIFCKNLWTKQIFEMMLNIVIH